MRQFHGKPRSASAMGIEAKVASSTTTRAPAGADTLLPGDVRRAVAYEELLGAPAPGERVRLEVSALDRRLGTGGHAMVTAGDNRAFFRQAGGMLTGYAGIGEQNILQAAKTGCIAHYGR